MEDKVLEANKPESYLLFEKDKDTRYRRGGSEDELYPVEGLQFYSEPTEEPKDCVSLSERQKARIQRGRTRSSIIIAKDLTNLNY